jgi:hypothetical protein
MLGLHLSCNGKPCLMGLRQANHGGRGGHGSVILGGFSGDGGGPLWGVLPHV